MLRVTADLHLRLDVPECRGETEEEWLELQFRSMDTLWRHARNFTDIPRKIVIAGDIFHRAVSSPKLTNIFLTALQNRTQVCIMPGNHDLQMRNPELGTTSFGTLVHFYPAVDDYFSSVPYGEEEVYHPEWEGKSNPSDILFIHRLVFASEADIPPGSDGISAKDLLELYPDYKIIVAGDNHEGFIYEKKGRKVLVPGSMTIQSAKGIGRKCYFYDIDEETFEITKHEYPDKGELVSREHLDKDNEREERLNAFVEALKKGGEVAFDFESNVMTMLNSSKIDEETKTTVKGFLYG